MSFCKQPTFSFFSCSGLYSDRPSGSWFPLMERTHSSPPPLGGSLPQSERDGETSHENGESGADSSG